MYDMCSKARRMQAQQQKAAAALHEETLDDENIGPQLVSRLEV